MAVCTADGKYDYSITINGISLVDHANRLNEYLERVNGWNMRSWPPSDYINMKPGQWGIDINVSRLAAMFPLDTTDIDVLAARAHEGWCRIFKWWFTHEPWIWKDSPYIRPARNLTTNDKPKRSITPYHELDEFQKKIYRQVAQYALDNMSLKPYYEHP